MSVVGGSSGDGPRVAEVFRLRESDTTVMTAMASRTDAMTKKKTSSDLRCLSGMVFIMVLADIVFGMVFIMVLSWETLVFFQSTRTS